MSGSHNRALYYVKEVKIIVTFIKKKKKDRNLFVLMGWLLKLPVLFVDEMESAWALCGRDGETIL